MSEWISVKERLPEEWFPVLVYCKFDDGGVVFTGYHSGETWYTMGRNGPAHIIAWMPLPEPPMEEDHGNI